MAHNLWIRNGQAAMFYIGDEPWHGLGTELKEPATAAQALAAAQLDFPATPRSRLGATRPVVTPLGD